MSAKKAWWVYSTIRIAMFAGIFALVWWLGARWWLAVLLAALLSMAVSILALDRYRQRAAEGLQEWRDRQHTDDSLFEDGVVDNHPDILHTSGETDSPADAEDPR